MKRLYIIFTTLFITFQYAIANDIVIGIVDSSTSPSFFKEGVHLAIQSLNHAGGTLGKKWRVITFDDENCPNKGQIIAEQISTNKNVIAVIGHRHPDVALSASIIYKDENILFVSPGTDINLYGGTYIFRHGPNDKTKAEKIANYAFQNSFKKIIIFSYYDSYEKVFADLFSKQANDKQITIVTRKSFSSWDKNFSSMISDAVSFGTFDAIFISGPLPLSGYLIKQIREMGIMVPILGSDNLDSSSLSIIAGKSAEDTIVPSIFDPTNPTKKTELFVDDFQAIYGMMPDTWAAMGYDTVKLLADVIEKSESCDPIVIDNSLRFLQQWKGVVGSYLILKNGILIPQYYCFKRFRNGGFEFPKRLIKKDQFELIRDKTLCLPIQTTIQTLDPALVNNPGVQDMLKLLFTGLTGFDKKNKLIPMLASSWEQRNNKTVYTFHLRKEALWHNNTPITAQDIVATLKRNIQPEMLSPNTHLLYALKNAKAIHKEKTKVLSELGVIAKDKYTVEFILERPMAYFPELLTLPVFWPLPSPMIQKDSNKWTQKEIIHVNGPYNLVYQDNDYLMIFRKNEAFFLEKEVNIPEIRFYVVPDGILGLDQYFNNELDVLAPIFIQIPVNELPMIRVNPRLRKEHTQFVGNTIYSIRFNINYPPVDETLIRKAIIQSIDKYKLTTIVTRGGEYMVNSFIPPKEYVDLKNCININYKPAQAQTRLSETGYPDGVGFPKLFISYEGAEYEKNIAQGLGAIISKNLNIDVELTENEKSHIVLVKRKASYYPGEYLSDLFMPNPLDNQISQSYKKIEILFNQMMLEIDSEKTLNLVKQAEKIMIQNEAVAMPLFVTNDHYLVNTRVKGWKNRFKGQHHLWQWSLQKGMNIK